MARGLVPVLLTLLVAVLLAVPAAVRTPAAQAAATQPPDIIVILTDDQRAGTERAMPYTWRFFQTPGRGVWYPNTQVPTNLCCPSRAALLTGRYPSATNVWDNSGAFGGYQALRQWEDRTLPVWLSAAGYRTGLFGKFVNEFGTPKEGQVGLTPPGWDQFFVFEGPQGAGYFANVRGIGAGSYTTDSLGQATDWFISSAPRNQPIFAYYSPFAPHSSYNAGPYKRSASPQVQRLARLWGAYRNPSFNVVTPGQPQWLRVLNPVSTAKTDRIVRKQTDTLQGVDANVRRIVASVARNRNLDNTLFVFLSDNGIAWGDHRLMGKRNPQVTVNEVPLMVRYPAGMRIPTTTTTDPRLANNVDVTATILAAAGIDRETDGRPLNEPTPRGFLPLMAAATVGRKEETIPRPAYCGVRTATHAYLEYATGERELYDLTADPYQLRNLAGSAETAALEADLQAKTDSTDCDLAWLVGTVGPNLPLK